MLPPYSRFQNFRSAASLGSRYCFYLFIFHSACLIPIHVKDKEMELHKISYQCDNNSMHVAYLNVISSSYPSLFVILFSSLSPQISGSGIKGTFLNICRDLPEPLDTGRADSAQVRSASHGSRLFIGMDKMNNCLPSISFHSRFSIVDRGGQYCTWPPSKE